VPLLKDMFGEGVLGNLSSIATSSAQMGAQNVIDAEKNCESFLQVAQKCIEGPALVLQRS
jgi:hypothetical protein